MIPVLGAALLFFSLSVSSALAQLDDAQGAKAIQPAAKTGVYKDLKKLEGKMQQTRTEKDRTSDKVDRINSDLKWQH